MSITLSVDFKQVGLHSATGDGPGYITRSITTYDLNRALANLGYEVIGFVPIENPRAHGFTYLEDALSSKLTGVPTNSRVSIRKIGKTDKTILTFREP